MRLGFRICGITYQEALPVAQKLGFKDMEPLWEPDLSKEFPGMAAMARDMGIQLTAVLTGTDLQDLDGFKRAFDDCKVIGAKSFTAHPHPLNPDDSAGLRAFEQRYTAAAELAEQMALKLAVPSCTLGPEQWDLMFRLVPALRLKYDPSFSAQAGRNYAAEIFRYGKRIVHAHAKDEINLGQTTDYNSGIVRMTYAPAGMGQINWGTVVAALYEVGFDEQIAIEPHSLYWCTAGFERGLVLAKRHLEQFIA